MKVYLIWLGYRVPLKLAKVTIANAYKLIPNLKYIHLSCDERNVEPPDYVHDTIFIGGDSSKARGYGLNTLKSCDFKKINTIKSQDALHEFIRSLY